MKTAIDVKKEKIVPDFWYDLLLTEKGSIVYSISTPVCHLGITAVTLCGEEILEIFRTKRENNRLFSIENVYMEQ